MIQRSLWQHDRTGDSTGMGVRVGIWALICRNTVPIKHPVYNGNPIAPLVDEQEGCSI